MTPRESLFVRRAEYLAIFKASLTRGQSTVDILREVQEFFAEIAHDACTGANSESTAHSHAESLLLGTSAAIVSLRSRIGQLASRSRTPVFILGETGVGKKHCARALHCATYPDGEWFEARSPERLREIDRSVAALRARTFTDSQAGMTIFVPELAELTPALQIHLSQLLDEQTVPLRLIGASDTPLLELARNGKLRKELQFRFSNELRLPPLRERKQDVPLLVQHFAKLYAAPLGVEPTSFTAAALNFLSEHSWPGNLTELKNVIERVSQELGARQADADDLPELGARPSYSLIKLPEGGIDLAELEREFLIQALAQAKNNQTRAAGLLGLTRDQIRYRLSKLDAALPVTGND